MCFTATEPLWFHDYLDGAIDLPAHSSGGLNFHPSKISFEISLCCQVHRLNDVEVHKLNLRDTYCRQLQGDLSAHRTDADDRC